jgi:hypothetical protein
MHDSMMSFKIKGVMRVQHTGEGEWDVYTFTRYAVDGLEWLLSEIEMSILCIFHHYSCVSRLSYSINKIESILGIKRADVIEVCDYFQKVGLIEYKTETLADFMTNPSAKRFYLTFNIYYRFETDKSHEKYILIPINTYLRLLAEKASSEL